VVFNQAIRPEESINSGVSATYKRSGDRGQWTVSADAWFTSFRNQFFPDYDVDPRLVVIQNFDQPSVSAAMQVEAIFDWKNGWSLRLAYNYLDVYRMVADDKIELPYTNRHKLLTVLGYRTRNQKWRFDHNSHWYSKPALPQIFASDGVVPPSDFWMGNLQATYVLRDWEFFGGCENFTDFRLLRPIVGYQNPFGDNFDTSFVWGPTRGREFYIGVRWNRKSFKKDKS
jgi:outer membrane receptor for ferrienterochelin and colicin